MRRVNVVGTACSGKTTMARRIAEHNGIPHIELDRFFWQPNWTPLPLDQYRSVVADLAAGERWVIDGNYTKVRDIVWARATDVVWMNISLATILWRVIRRTIRRGVTHEEVFAGNQETIRNAILSRDSLIWWTIRMHRRRTRAILETLASDEFSGLQLHEIRMANDPIPLLDLSQK